MDSCPVEGSCLHGYLSPGVVFLVCSCPGGSCPATGKENLMYL